MDQEKIDKQKFEKKKQIQENIKKFEKYFE